MQLPAVTRDHRPDLIAGIERMPSSRLIGLTVAGLAPGASVVEVPIRADLTFDGRGVQAGILGMVADYAAVSAATAAMPPGWLSATTSFDVHVLEPARGDRLLAVGTAIKAGKGTCVASANIYAIAGDARTLVATALATCRVFEPKP